MMRISGFLKGNVSPTGNFLLVQKVTKDTPGGGAFYKDAPPPVPPPSEDKIDVLICHLGDFVNRIAPPPKILEIAKDDYAMPIILLFYCNLLSFSVAHLGFAPLPIRGSSAKAGGSLSQNG